MFRHIQQFLHAPMPSREQSMLALRLTFVLMFWVQALIALILTVMVWFLAPSNAQASGVMQAVVLVLDVLLLPVALLLSHLSGRAGGKQGALAASLMLGVLLAMSSWLALFAWVIGVPRSLLVLLISMVLLYYTVGFFISGSYARYVTREPKRVKSEG